MDGEKEIIDAYWSLHRTFLNIIFLLFYVYGPECTYVHYMLAGAPRDQKKTLDLLELEV